MNTTDPNGGLTTAFRRNGQQQSLPPANTLKNLESNLKKLGLGEQSAALASNISAIDAFIETNLDNSQENEQTMRIQASRAALAEALDTLDILKVGLYDRMVYAILDFLACSFPTFEKRLKIGSFNGRLMSDRHFSAPFSTSAPIFKAATPSKLLDRSDPPSTSRISRRRKRIATWTN